MKKRLFVNLMVLAISMVMVMGVSSCGKKEETAPAPEPVEESQPEVEKEPAVVTQSETKETAAETKDVKQETEETSASENLEGTTESVETPNEAESQEEGIETTQLYKDFFEPYAAGVGKVLVNGFQSSAEEKFDSYEIEVTEGNEEDSWEYKIYDDNGDYVYLMFYPINIDAENSDDWIWTLTLLTYKRGDEKEISVSDGFHAGSKLKYNTWQSDRDPKNQEVTDLSELTEFMFGVQ